MLLCFEVAMSAMLMLALGLGLRVGLGVKLQLPIVMQTPYDICLNLANLDDLECLKHH
jgi:hypothetical protein